ncbi:hypothetical protein PQO01_19540 [Lentisphaera marina]|uniref:hypothetical protein n=1 Tax=Lentisphaera marina TaxID=1111041 RepID=UPI002365C83B|nr:hypothetical protein [Lentisphaera marina]MDD7987150.1 hypothetical protein [Lentisphaera marina]
MTKVTQFIESFLGSSASSNQSGIVDIHNFEELNEYIKNLSFEHEKELEQNEALKKLNIGFSFCLKTDHELYQIGISKSGWLIVRIKPEPTGFIKSSSPSNDETLVPFYLPGWRDIPKSELINELEAINFIKEII